MSRKGEISNFKAWLLVFASLIDDILVLALVFLALRLFHVKITWSLLLVIGLAMAGFIFIMHRAVIPAIRRRKVTGAEGMLGMTGQVTETLGPSGTVKIKGEYWKATSTDGNIKVGEPVEVTGINGLELEVKKKS
jgi:membrane-bound serine protease (ClpP class)